ncbi:MAG TPA: CTP synthase [Candidatus Atribacteria bacterium]|nr:CTP synthase [Candidatus Atribacteria bacterium]
MTKFIFVTGGVVSGLGKGITAAALGRLLKQRGLKVAVQKLDPYMNVDPGTMSPYQHGEVFVTDDGAETDLDLGHYERFIDESLNKLSNLTSGKVYWNVLNRERTGGYLGETVQVIPHITGEIKDFIYAGARKSGADVMIVEIGGTTGDIESQPFLEAIRQISLEVGHHDCLFIHVTLVPYLKGSGEHKSKPTQHSVKELRSMGISPGIIVARSDEPLDESIKAKISLFCNVKPDCVIENRTLPCLYEAPIMLHENGLDRVVCRELKIDAPEPDLSEWKAMLSRIGARNSTTNIAIVGKYVKLHDAYLSIIESLNHAGFEAGTRVNIQWIDSESVEAGNVNELFKDTHGIIVPGGFGDRGIEGKITACRYARENKVPFLGICLGMQVAVIEFARNAAGLHGANSAEFDPAARYRVIDIMPDQVGITQKGGTMRLGAYPCRIAPGTLMHRLYGAEMISERHRHRYEFSNEYRDVLTQNGLCLSGTSPDGRLVEAVELREDVHPFYIGVQFHPEFLSRPNKPHPLFHGLIKAAMA